MGVVPDEWPNVIGQFDIGIAPMDMRPVETATGTSVNDDKSYDERRSWLKLAEYLVGGVPFVCTDCAPYSELKQFGLHIENGEANWHAALKRVIENYDARYKMAQEDMKYARRKLTAEANAERLIALYNRIGEETQARKGMKLPEVIYELEPKETEVPFEAPAIMDKGDPFLTGRKPWAERSYDAVEQFVNSARLFVGSIDVGRVMAYHLLEKVNDVYARREQQASPPDDRGDAAPEPVPAII